MLPRSATIVWIDGSGSSHRHQLLRRKCRRAGLAVELNGGRLGNVNLMIYTLSAVQTMFGGPKRRKQLQIFHRNIEGNNNAFTVKPGQAFSEVLGTGTLDVKNFLGLQAAAPAGAPNTPSNP